MNAQITVINKLWKAMTVEEKQELIINVGEWAETDGLVPKDAPKKKGGFRKVGKSSKPYWIRRAKGIDKTAKGMFQVEGDWVSDVKKDCEYGDVVVVGTKGDTKKYYVCTRDDSETLRVTIEGGHVELDGVKVIRESDRFGSLLTVIEDLLAK